MIVYRDVVVNGTTTQTKIFDIAECTYTGKDMGERSIVANIKWPSPIDFEIGDYVMLPMQSLVRSANGVDGSVLSGMDMERFYIYSMPTIKKNARPLSSGQAFEHTVTFYPAQYELGLIQMRDCGQEQANADTIIYTGFDSLSFVGGAYELMRRIMAVLKEAYHDADGNPLWSYQIADAANENKNTALERVSFSFSGNSVMDALLKLNDKEGLNTSFFINGRTIYVGYKRPYFCRVTDGGSIDTNPDTQMFQFEYGKTSHQSIAINHGGLYQIIKTLGKETPITKLFAYGAARNLNRYYCSDRIKSGRYVNRVMLPSFDSDGKTDYILSEEGVKKYGIRESSKQFEEIYPSLRYMTYGDLRQIKYCVKVRYSGITNDKLEQGGSAYPVARVQCYKVVPSGKTTGINKLVEAAPPDDLCVIVHAMGKTVKVVLYGGNTDDEAIQKQRQHDSKVPTRTANGTDYIPGSCFLVHDRGFDTNKTYQNANRSAWFTNPNSFPTSLTDAQKTEINMNQIQYEDTFWLSDLYVFEGYGQMHFSRDGYSAWSWPRTNIDYMGGSADSTAVNEVVAAEPIVIEDTSSNVDDLTTQQKTFDLYLKDVGFQIDEQNDFGDMVFIVGSTLKISMLDGLMAGREFEAAGKVTDSQYTCICAYKEDGSLNDDFFMDSDYNKGKTIPQAALNAGAIWRVCCSRINLDEADYSNLNLILPTKDLCVKKGDHLVFLDIFMPDIYIHAAENRLLREARKYLEANDSGNVTYSAQFDKVRLQQIPNYALQMREGLNIRMVDDDLDISTENDGRYLSNYGEKGLYSAIDVPYTRSAWEYVTTYKTATAHGGVTQEFIDKFGRAVSESGSTYMTVRIVLQYDETWIDRAPVQIIRSGTTYNLGVPKRVLSYGWSEADGGYLYMLIFATPIGLNLSNSVVIKRHQIKADSALKKSVWLSSNDAIDFTRGRFYTFKCSVKDTGYLAAANALALFSTKNDGIDGAKYLPTYTMQAEHKEKSGLLYLTFKFELPSNFNDDVVYYPSVLFNTDSRESSVGMWVESMYEKDFADGTNKLNYADFTIDSLTIKITDSSDGAPIREISATFAEHPAATTWATLMANIETVKIDGEQNVKAIETLVNTARKNYQTLLNLRNSIFDPDGTCDQAFLQVMMLQVGADSMNYQLDKTRTGLSANGQQVFHNCSCKKDGSGKWHFEVDAADTLRHFVYTQGGQGGTWDITNGIDVSLDGKSNYFVCVKCSREGNNGTWICSTKQYAVNDEEDTTAWFFNWGILTVDSAGNYTLVETRGNAYMYGDNLVCGKISTLAGNSYFDLTHGNFVLSDGTSKALSYENGILTIGGVNDESADSILTRLGLTENVANNAKSTADDAKSVADAATTRLNNWAADGVISPVEKQGIKDEIARIDADKSQITAEYTKYGLGTPTAFNTAHTNYRAVLVTLSANNPENIAIPADFSTKQTAYYTARTTALNAISTKADEVANAYADKVSASAAKAALDNLQIGGRNLVLNSDGSSTANIFAYGDCYAARVVKDYDGGTGNEIYIGKSKQPDAGYTYAQSVWIRAKSNFELDTDYVLSFDARLLSSSGFTSIPVYLRLAGTAYGTSVMKKVEVTKDLKRVSVVLHSHPTDPYNYGTLFIGVPTTIIYISKVKLEKGNKATDWTPAPEDVEASIAENKTYADGLVKALGDNLQNQIDGVVDSYFLEGKPTNSNYPANEWTTDELKKRHEGDTYTDITEYIDNETTPTAGHSWRWCRGSSDNPATTWHWHEIADSDAVRALQNAAKAQDTADGKRRVFVVQPTPPYEVGDLWAQGDGEGKDILKCKTARAAGQTFAQADWEAASSALRTAGSAQEAAEEAKKTLANIASDSVFTKQEKCAVRTEWASIQAEFTKNTNNAKVCWGESGYGNNTEYKAYSTAYTALNNYLTNTAKLSVNEDTEIKPDEFNKAFSDYYGANVTLLNAIAKRVSELEAAAAIDNLEVGGENLYTGDNPLTIAANNSNYNNQVFTCKLQNGEQYVFSCGKSVVKSGNTDKYTILLYDDTVTPNAGFGYWKLPVSATKVEKTFVVPNSGNWQIRLYAGEFHYTAGVSIEFTDIMVQKGNKATEYQKPIRKFLYNGNVSIPYKNTDYAQSKLLASGVYAGTYYTEMASESKGAGVTTANRDAFMNSCLVWFVAGKPQTTENVLKITDWGEAVNISQRADVYVYTGQAAFVKSHIQDPTSTRIEFTANGTWTISGAQISTYKMEYLEGETYEAKTKAEALDYLKAAMANGSTKVAGGLLMTNVLMLRDLANNVTAGLSGLTKYKPSGSSTTLEDLVLLWGGATYDEAFYAARNAGYLKKAGGDPITTLLKKDGTGKIGIFKISDTQAVIDVPNQGKVVIDASTANGGIFIKDSGGIDRVVISPLSLNSFGLASTHDLGKASILKTVNDTQDKDLSGTVSYSKSFVAGKTGTLESSFSIVTEINASVMINSGKGYPSATAGYNTLYVTIKDTTSGTTVFTQSLSTLSVTASANNTTTSNISDSKYDGKIYPVSIKIQVVKGHNYTFSISGTAIVRGNIGGTSSGYDAEVHASLSITSQSNIKLLYTDMCAYLCVDGMSVAANSELKFDVMKSGTNLKVLAQGLPTTTSGLSAGQIYKDSSGILRIWGGK